MAELIADLPIDERPRERLRKHGAETLSDAELIAILLGSGVRGKNAIQLARELLCDGIGSLAGCDSERLAQAGGVGPAKATRIVAAFELARRLASTEEPIRYDDEAFGRSLISRYGHEPQEHLGALFLDSRQRVLRQRELYVGTVSRALVSTRDVIRYALEANAIGVVLFHNHPSGDPSPSAEDLTFTRRVQQSLQLVELELIDHLVIGANRYCSMRGKGLL